MKVVAILVAFVWIRDSGGMEVSQKSLVKQSQLYFYSPFLEVEIPLEDVQRNSSDLYKPEYPVKVLVHGWNGDRNHITVAPIRNAYLSLAKYNLIIADWSAGASQVYHLSRALVYHVGKRLAKKLKSFLEFFNVAPESIHILGHSLGAHVAGNIGKHFDGRVGRITGLDPANPNFNRSSADACKSTDALFVDIIHTDSGILGQFLPSGHVDFYPNRGFAAQPGCKMLDWLTTTGCSHYRAPLLFAESILLPRNFLAAQCSKEELLKSIRLCQPKNNQNGRGTRALQFMGEETDRNASGLFYLETNNSPPYGKGLIF